jgi:hypothetical protein
MDALVNDVRLKPDALEQLTAAILNENAQPHGAERLTRATPNPYPGLRYFTSEISEVFVGRDEQIGQILGRLEKSQTVLILGGSGCGKSSLVRGGVLARLSGAQPVPGRYGAWYSISWRPERTPCRQLKEAFWRDFAEPALSLVRARQAFLDEQIATARATAAAGTAPCEDLIGARAPDPLETLEQRKERLLAAMPRAFRPALAADARPAELRSIVDSALDEILAAASGPAHQGLAELRLLIESIDRLLAEAPGAPGANVLFVVDQFEEAFRSEVDRQERRTLMALIRYVYELKPRGVFLALVMRSEDLHRCAEEPHLPEIVNTSSMFVDWLDRAQLRQVISQPACRVLRSWLRAEGLEDVPDTRLIPFSPELIEDLLDDAEHLKATLEHKGDHLPLLQHGLRVLWRTAAIHWSRVVTRVRSTGAALTTPDLRIGAHALEALVSEARQRVRERNPKDTAERTSLQWLLTDSA